MSTKIAQGKEALEQTPFIPANPSTALEDILNDDNIIQEEEDELTTFTQ